MALGVFGRRLFYPPKTRMESYFGFRIKMPADKWERRANANGGGPLSFPCARAPDLIRGCTALLFVPPNR